MDPNIQLDDPMTYISYSGGCSALHAASAQNRFPVVRYLIEEARADAQIRNNRGETALHMACRQRPTPHQTLDVIRYLVETAGLRADAKDSNGNTPLHRACFSQCSHIVQYLVEHGRAKIDAEADDGMTPLTKSFR